VNGSVLALLVPEGVVDVSVFAATPLVDVGSPVSFDGDVPFVGVVGVVGVVAGVVGVVGVVVGVVVVVFVVVGVVLYPDNPSLAASADVGAMSPALTTSASAARETRERAASPPVATAPRGLLEAMASDRIMPTSVIVRMRLGPDFMPSLGVCGF